MWNPCDVVVVVFFLVGLVLRLQAALMSVGRLLFCVDIIYWYLRIFTILSVNKYLGPLVTMMDKMVKNMIYFVVLLLVVLISFGVCRQAILFPDNEANWGLIKDIFFQVGAAAGVAAKRTMRDPPFLTMPPDLLAALLHVVRRGVRGRHRPALRGQG